METDLVFKLIKPNNSLADFVESFWMLHNPTDSPREIIVLPDGRIDLFFSQSATAPFHITLSGLETHPDQAVLAAHTLMFAVSFKLLATEYIIHNTISSLLNYAAILPTDFWDFCVADLQDFNLFCKKASHKITSLLPQETDNRKRETFRPYLCIKRHNNRKGTC